MRTLGMLLASAALVGMTASAVPAEAHGWKHGHYNGENWRGGHHRPNGAAIALGILGGALTGAAIASAPRHYYPYPYTYAYPYYGYAYPY